MGLLCSGSEFGCPRCLLDNLSSPSFGKRDKVCSYIAESVLSRSKNTNIVQQYGIVFLRSHSLKGLLTI